MRPVSNFDKTSPQKKQDDFLWKNETLSFIANSQLSPTMFSNFIYPRRNNVQCDGCVSLSLRTIMLHKIWHSFRLRLINEFLS